MVKLTLAKSLTLKQEQKTAFSENDIEIPTELFSSVGVCYS